MKWLFIGIIGLGAYISGHAQTMLPVSVDGKWGFINLSGEVIHQPQYIGYFIADNGQGQFTYYVKNNEGIFILSPDGNVLQSLGRFAGEIKSIVKNRFVITKPTKYFSLYDIQGKQILIDSFDEIKSISEDYFIVQKRKKFNISNSKGELLLHHYVNQIRAYDRHFFISDRDSSWLIDTIGNTISSKLRGTYLVVDKRGTNEPSYLYNNMQFYMMVKRGDKYHPFLFNSRETINDQYSLFSDTFGKSLLHHTSGKQLFFSDYTFTDLPCLSQIAASKGDTTWLYDSLFQLSDSMAYAKIECDETLLLTYNSTELMGISDFSGKAIVEPSYNYISAFYNKLAIYQSTDTSGFGVMNDQGKIVIKDEFDEITLDSQLVVGLKGKVKYFYELDNRNVIIGQAIFNNISQLKTGRINSPPRMLGGNTGRNNNVGCTTCNWFKNDNTRKYGLMNDDSSVAIAPTLDGYTQIGKTSYFLVWRFGSSSVLPNSGLMVEGRAFGIVDYKTRKIVLKLAYNYIDTSAIRRNNGLFKVRLYSLARGNELLLNAQRTRALPYNFVFSLSNGYFIASNSRTMRFGIEEDLSYGTSVELIQQLTLESAGMLIFSNNAIGKSGILSPGNFYVLDDLGRICPDSKANMIKREKFGHMVAIREGLYGIMNNRGGGILNFDYNFISDHHYTFADSLYLVYNSVQKMGVINNKSKVLVGAEYTQLQRVDENGYTTGKLGNMWYIINVESVKIELFEIIKTMPFQERLAGAKRKNKWGFIDYNGRFVIDPIYNRVSSFNNGMACVKLGSEYFYIDASGERVSDAKYSEATDYFGEFALVANKGIRKKFVIINSKGVEEKEKFKSYEYQKQYQIMMARKRRKIKLLSEEKLHEAWYTKSYYTKYSSHILFKTKGHEFHIFDENGRMTGKVEAHDVKPFEEGYCIITNNRKQAVINALGEIVYGPTDKKITQVFDSFVVVKYDKFMYIERFTGETINMTKAKSISIININNIVQIRADGRMFLASEIGIFNTLHRVNLVDLKENITAVKTNEGMRIIDSTGFYNNQKLFSKISRFKNGYALFNLNGNYGLFQLTNANYKWLLNCHFDKLEPLNGNLLRYEKDNEFGYINLLNKQIIWKGVL